MLNGPPPLVHVRVGLGVSRGSVVGSAIVGSTVGDGGQCAAGSTACRAKTTEGAPAEQCRSVFGPGVRRVGIALPRYVPLAAGGRQSQP